MLWGCLFAGSAMAAAAATRTGPSEAVPPLLADDGSAYPAAQRVAAAEAAAGGPAPGWATAAQLQRLQQLHPARVVRVRADERGSPSPASLAPEAWVFVEGHDEGAVRLARRLSAAGVQWVWVLLPAPTPSGPGSRP
jgi:hypothetical protein